VRAAKKIRYLLTSARFSKRGSPQGTANERQ
jgi:hypothetical protein